MDGEADPNLRDGEGIAPLIWAVIMGHQTVVEELLGWEQVSVYIPKRTTGLLAGFARNAGSALAVAAAYNRQNIFNTLLGHSKVEMDWDSLGESGEMGKRQHGEGVRGSSS